MRRRGAALSSYKIILNLSRNFCIAWQVIVPCPELHAVVQPLRVPAEVLVQRLKQAERKIFLRMLLHVFRQGIDLLQR